MASYRIATLEDAPMGARCLLDFHKAANLPFRASAAWADALFRSCVTDDDRLALMHESGNGVLLAVAGQSLLGPFVQAQEIAWWVHPDHRGRSAQMVGAYEEWATKIKGAHLVGMVSLDSMPELDKLYAHLGYTKMEQHWVKAF